MKNKLIKLLGGFTKDDVDRLVLVMIKKDRLKRLKNNKKITKTNLPDYDTFTDGWRERE